MQQLLTIITTAVLTYAFTLAVPYVKNKYNAFKHAKKRKLTADTTHTLTMDILNNKINDLQKQIDNVIDVKYNRDKNRKYNIRRDVREYLKELQND